MQGCLEEIDSFKLYQNICEHLQVFRGKVVHAAKCGDIVPMNILKSTLIHEIDSFHSTIKSVFEEYSNSQRNSADAMLRSKKADCITKLQILLTIIKEHLGNKFLKNL